MIQGPQDLPDYVWILTILHRAGTEIYVFSRWDIAREQLFKYIQEEWYEEYPFKDMPLERDEAIDNFFHENERTSFILVQEEVLESTV
jgi:hypothetical protein